MSENSRLGRCSSCRFWKSATEILAERVPPDASSEDIATAEASVRTDLSQEILNPDGAVNRGWCQLAEQGTGKSPHLSINLATDEPARAITSHDYGCINYEPRPRRAIAEPVPNYLENPGIGRCAGCRNWSSADNEAKALYAMYQYAGEHGRMEECQREAYTKLSPKPFSVRTGGVRGWCKVAANQDPWAKILAFDPMSGYIGALITTSNYACTMYEGTANPEITTSPDYRWLANRDRLHNWGAAAPIDDLYWAHGDSGQILNPENLNSPMNELNPRAMSNPQNLALNPNPAYAVYRMSDSLVNIITKPDPNKPQANPTPAAARLEMPATQKQPEPGMKQDRATARLAANFGKTTRKKDAPKMSEGGQSGVNLSKKKTAEEDRRKKQSPQFKKSPTPGGGGPTDRRRG